MHIAQAPVRHASPHAIMPIVLASRAYGGLLDPQTPKYHLQDTKILGGSSLVKCHFQTFHPNLNAMALFMDFMSYFDKFIQVYG